MLKHFKPSLPTKALAQCFPGCVFPPRSCKENKISPWLQIKYRRRGSTLLMPFHHYLNSICPLNQPSFLTDIAALFNEFWSALRRSTDHLSDPSCSLTDTRGVRWHGISQEACDSAPQDINLWEFFLRPAGELRFPHNSPLGLRCVVIHRRMHVFNGANWILWQVPSSVLNL